MQSPAPMHSPAHLHPPINYQELEGGHWTPPTKAQRQRHLEQHLQQQQAPQTSAATRVAFMVAALLLVSYPSLCTKRSTPHANPYAVSIEPQDLKP